MVAGVVEHDDHAAARRPMTQQLGEKAAEGLGIEHLSQAVYEPAGAQVDRAETGDRFAGRRMPQDGVLDLRGHPHAAARAVLLEVAFVQAPQFNVGP